MWYCARSCELEIRKVGERWLLHGRRKFLVGRGSLVAVRPLFRCSTNYRVGTARSRWNNRDYLPRNEKPGFRSDVSPDWSENRKVAMGSRRPLAVRGCKNI